MVRQPRQCPTTPDHVEAARHELEQCSAGDHVSRPGRQHLHRWRSRLRAHRDQGAARRSACAARRAARLALSSAMFLAALSPAVGSSTMPRSPAHRRVAGVAADPRSANVLLGRARLKLGLELLVLPLELGYLFGGFGSKDPMGLDDLRIGAFGLGMLYVALGRLRPLTALADLARQGDEAPRLASPGLVDRHAASVAAGDRRVPSAVVRVVVNTARSPSRPSIRRD